MSHFAKIENSIVTKVIVATQAEINSERYGDAFNWVQCSYNGNFRGKFAAVNDIYDKSLDAFYAPQPYPSWTLNEDTCLWEAPVAYPDDDKMYDWDEETQSWDEVTPEV